MGEIAEYVLAHHERLDGSGYPKGLKGSGIPIQARIIAIADAYDAMTSARSYRGALSDEVAVEELKKNAGTQFDSDLVNLFIDNVIHSPQKT
jgi:HD-GYP domain-containing protein (c-di-GMP phosphodiesterase class II)